MIFYRKNSCIPVGNYKEFKVAQWPVNTPVCPSLPPIVVAHCFGSPCYLPLSNNSLGLVPNPNKNIEEIPMDYDREKKCYQKDMSY